MNNDLPSPNQTDTAASDGVARTMFFVCLVAGLSFVIVIFAKIL
jgi:hypothetical protein